ncbi:GNAT family N-acetyltransferase [Kitasatospora sp. NPDC087314]|uniref:GNAT family N-acetyltransferase n=1 Tax=Kitasatospora sp. NPDC087314 TaxID=3364068 RepID=UPI003827E1AD
MDAATTLTVTYCTAEDSPAIEQRLIAVYAEVYAAEAASDPFFSIERFTQRLHSHAAAPRWGCAFGEVGGEPVGYAYGFARTTSYRWNGLVTPVPAEDLAETDTRTFALCEVMVRSPWRGSGIARILHDELLSHRIEERSHLLVEEEHPRVRALYERWGYRWMGTMQPFPDAPRYDSMFRPIC